MSTARSSNGGDLDVGEVHDTTAARLRREGQRYTGNRQELVEVLARTDRPLTIPELLEASRGLAQSSAYRNLAVLERAGVVHRIVTSDEFARYELAEDLTGHHHHLICSTCGSVEDFTVAPRLERSLDQAADQVVAETGFTVERHRLDLLGVCSACS